MSHSLSYTPIVPASMHLASDLVMYAQATEDVLGKAAKITLGKENTTIVGDGSTQEAVAARVRQIKNVISQTEQDYEREKLNERVAR